MKNTSNTLALSKTSPRWDTSTIQVVILAAGKGTRLGRDLPKPLTELGDGRTIMGQQFDNIFEGLGVPQKNVTLVVGYRFENIVEAFPNSKQVHNPNYDITNTSKSLLLALKASRPGGVLWMNGDVVYDPEILYRAKGLITADISFVSVNTSKVSEEEVKYLLDSRGLISQLSKTVVEGVGEAVGINYISSKDKLALIRRLHQVEDQDYFEKGLELAIKLDGVEIEPLDISDLYAVEVDFSEDLDQANLFV